MFVALDKAIQQAVAKRQMSRAVIEHNDGSSNAPRETHALEGIAIETHVDQDAINPKFRNFRKHGLVFAISMRNGQATIQKRPTRQTIHLDAIFLRFVTGSIRTEPRRHHDHAIALFGKLMGKSLREHLNASGVRRIERGEYRICARLPQSGALLLVRLVKMPALVVIEPVQRNLLG